MEAAVAEAVAGEVRGRGPTPSPGRCWRSPIAAVLFFTSSASTTVASHDAMVRPTTDNYVTLRTGPFLPDVRAPSGTVIGVEVTLGKTETRSTEELVERYAFIASQPDAQVERVQRVFTGLAYDAALRGAVLALVPLLVWAPSAAAAAASSVTASTSATAPAGCSPEPSCWCSWPCSSPSPGSRATRCWPTPRSGRSSTTT